MTKIKFLTLLMLGIMAFTMCISIPVTYAAPGNSVLNTLTGNTISAGDDGGSSGSNIFEKFFGFIFDKILGPIFNIFGSKSTTGSAESGQSVKVTPLPPSSGSGGVKAGGSLSGKTIVIDPGHGGSNPGAVANNSRESDHNLAVGLKLRDKLVQAGAKVVMTRDTDRTVAAEGSSLGKELQARIDLAEANHADIFVSVHSNSNPNPDIAGAMTFYHDQKSAKLASAVQDAMIEASGAADKGTSTATFYVLRNASMPAVLVEMGFMTNSREAARLSSDAYRTSLANGIFNGIAAYFKGR